MEIVWVTKFQNKNSGGETSTSVPFFSKKEAEEQAFMHIMIGDKAWIEKVQMGANYVNSDELLLNDLAKRKVQDDE